jgi:trigger factor
VAAVKRKKLPPLDDEFAKDCGPYSSLAELREKLHGEMEKALKKDIEETYKDTILKRLVDTHHFEVPETLIEREVTAMVRQALQARQRQRGRAGEAGDPTLRQEELKKLQEESRPEAIRRVKVGLILEAVADKEGLTVEAEDIKAEYERLGAELRLAPEEVRRLIEAGGEDSREELKARIQADKALEFVYRHAVIQG